MVFCGEEILSLFLFLFSTLSFETDSCRKCSSSFRYTVDSSQAQIFSPEAKYLSVHYRDLYWFLCVGKERGIAHPIDEA